MTCSGMRKEGIRLLFWDKLVFDADIVLVYQLGRGLVVLCITLLHLMVYIKQHRIWQRIIFVGIVDCFLKMSGKSSSA